MEHTLPETNAVQLIPPKIHSGLSYGHTRPLQTIGRENYRNKLYNPHFEELKISITRVSILMLETTQHYKVVRERCYGL